MKFDGESVHFLGKYKIELALRIMHMFSKCKKVGPVFLYVLLFCPYL